MATRSLLLSIGIFHLSIWGVVVPLTYNPDINSIVHKTAEAKSDKDK